MLFDLLILSDIRFIREGLADALACDRTFRIAGVAPDLEQACGMLTRSPASVILIDTALPQGIAAVGRLHECAPESKIVAFALRDTETDVIAWAQAGICGYIPRNTPLSALVELLTNVVHGEQVCPTRVASGMLRWIAQHASDVPRVPLQCANNALTLREQQVTQLIDGGLSNKEISRRLGISLATTKSHVHNILAKLGVTRRVHAVQRLRVGRERADDTQ